MGKIQISSGGIILPENLCDSLIDSITSSEEVMEYLNELHLRKKKMKEDEINEVSEFIKELSDNNINLESASSVFSFLHDLKSISKRDGINYVSKKVIRTLGDVSKNSEVHDINEGSAFPFKLIRIAETLSVDEFFNNLRSVIKDPKNLVYGDVKFSEKVLTLM